MSSRKGYSAAGNIVHLLSGSVQYYANLPTPVVDYVNEFWLVQENSGGLLSAFGIYKYPKGVYCPNISNVWEQVPFSVKVSEDSITLLNITNWTQYTAYAIDIHVGDRLTYNDITYKNLTGIQGGTAPDTDTTNWEIAGVMASNQTEYLYLKGDLTTDGSIRLSVNPATTFARIEKRVTGVWQPASFEVGSNSLWVGKTVGVAGLGHHLATESSDGHLHFHVHSEYDGELTVEDAAVVFADFYMAYLPVQPDESEEWTGESFDYVHHTTSHALLETLYIKIGATTPTTAVRLQVWQGADDTGPIAFDQYYPFSDFSPNTEVPLHLTGKLEFNDDTDYLFRYSSEETFSLKTDTTGVQPTLAIAFSRVREDCLLQTAPWVDGNNYEEKQWLIKDRDIYICNTTGIQTGTFEDNADKWNDIQEYADYKSILAQSVQTTGLLEGGEISIASATTLNWTAGKGLHTDFTDPTNPIVTRIAWDAVTGYTPVNVATPGQYIVAYDKTGTIVEFDTVNITARKIRDLIIFGGYATAGNYITLISTSAINIGYDGFFSFKDFMRDVIGPANIEGNIISANGTNLSLDNNGGTFFIIGSNFRDDKEITDEKQVSPGTAVYFSRVFREAPPSTKIQTDVPGLVNVVDPIKWDDGSGTLQTITGNKYSIQVVYLTPDGHYVVAFGQELFNTAANAEEAVITGALSYEEYPLLERFVRRAFLIVQSNETDLNNAIFLPEGKFRIGGTTSGAGVKIHSSLTGLEWDVAGHLFENGGILDIQDYDFRTMGNIAIQNNLISKQSDGMYIGKTRISELPWKVDDTTGWQTWTAKGLDPGGGKRWRSVAMSGDARVQLAVGDEGQQIYVSHNYGQTWTGYNETKSYMGCACSADGKYMTVGVMYGNIRISSDYGVTWTQTSSPTPSWAAMAMDATGKYQVATCGADGAAGDLYLSNDYGVTWVAQGLGNAHRNGVVMSSDGKYIIVTDGEANDILRSTDYGETWAYTGPGVGRLWNNISMSTDGRYILITSMGMADGRVRVSSDYGDSWFSATGCPNAYWGGCAMSADGKYMILGVESGLPREVYMSDDYGDNFSAVSGTDGQWTDFAMSADGIYRLGASDGYDLFTSSDIGVNLNGHVGVESLSVNSEAPIYTHLHGLSLTQDEEAIFEIVHINSPTKSSFFKYDSVLDKFSMDKSLEIPSLIVNSIEIVGTDGEVNKSTVEDSDLWDTAYGWGDHSLEGYLTAETDPVFTAWDKSTGISITESQISDLQSYLLTETDPIFAAWDKSTGISITESQISDLNHFVTEDETDPIFIAWDKSSGISITESQISDLDHFSKQVADLLGMTINRIPYGSGFGGLTESANFTYDGNLNVGNGGIFLDRTGNESFISFSKDGVGQGQLRGGGGKIYIGDPSGSPVFLTVDTATGVTSMDSVDTPEIYNSAGLFKIQPDAQGDVELFGDTNVDNSENSKIFKIWRRAPEGNDYIRMYISQTRNCYIHASNKLTLQAQVPFTINSVTDDIIFKVGDNAGVKKFYFQDSDNTDLVIIDSNGGIKATNLPTSDPTDAGAFWNDGGTVKISAG